MYTVLVGDERLILVDGEGHDIPADSPLWEWLNHSLPDLGHDEWMFTADEVYANPSTHPEDGFFLCWEISEKYTLCIHWDHMEDCVLCISLETKSVREVLNEIETIGCGASHWIRINQSYFPQAASH